MNQAARRRLNIILTQKAILMLILVFASTACDVNDTGVDGQCIDDRTGEPLKQVRDVDGQLWAVEKAVEELGTLTLEPTFPISTLQGLPQSATAIPDVAE